MGNTLAIENTGNRKKEIKKKFGNLKYGKLRKPEHTIYRGKQLTLDLQQTGNENTEKAKYRKHKNKKNKLGKGKIKNKISTENKKYRKF